MNKEQLTEATLRDMLENTTALTLNGVAYRVVETTEDYVIAVKQTNGSTCVWRYEELLEAINESKLTTRFYTLSEFEFVE